MLLDKLRNDKPAAAVSRSLRVDDVLRLQCRRACFLWARRSQLRIL